MILSDIKPYLNPATLNGALALAVLLVAVGLVLTWGIRRALNELILHSRSERLDQIAVSFLTRLCVLGLWIGLLTIYAHLVPPLNKLGTALLAGASLVSVIVGFAAQTTLSNLISGISLVLYKPFRRGDRLQVLAPTPDQCETGVVQDISLGFTVLQTDDGREIIVANATMAQQTMIKLLPAAAPAATAPTAPTA